MKIAYLTDTHIDESAPKKHGADARLNFEATLDELKKNSPDLVVFGGDIGTAESHPYFFGSLADFELKIVLGNHDKAEDVAKRYPEPLKLGKLYYAMREMGHTFIFLDSSDGKVSEEQLTFLRDQTQAADKVLLFIHHPVLAVDSPVDLKYPLKNRDQVLQILADSGKTVGIFCGHNHCEDETSSGKISQYVTPAVSYQILKHHRKMVGDASYFGWRIIHLSDDGFVTNFDSLNP